MGAGDRAYWSDLANTIYPPLVRLVAQATQSIAAAVAVQFGTGSEEVDTHGFHDTATNNSRITPTVAGWYRLTATVNMQSAAYSQILMVFRKNAANVAPLVPFRPDAAAAAAGGVQLTATVSANGSGDYFEIVTQSTPAGTTAFASGGVQTSVFECEFIRPL
jgi:hypothetical protein